MSDEKDKKFKVNMSFEEAMKKVATTKANPAILIEGKDKRTLIPNASGKWIEFVRLNIAGKPIEKYWLQVWITAKEGNSRHYELPLYTEPFQRISDGANFELVDHVNPVFVDLNCSASVCVISNPNDPGEDFKMCALTYKVS